MYDKCNQHSELIRLIGAAAVSRGFRQRLLENPELVLERGYLGYQFNLTAEEVALVTNAAGGNIQEFSLQVWEWMGRNGHGNGAHLEEKPSNEGRVYASPVYSAANTRVREQGNRYEPVDSRCRRQQRDGQRAAICP